MNSCLSGSYNNSSSRPPPHLGSASPAPECTSRVGGVMERCTVRVESAVRWITLPTVPLGPSCREKSPPYWAMVEQELHRLLHQEPGPDPGRELQVRLEPGVDRPVALEPEVETSPSRKRGRRDGDFMETRTQHSNRQVHRQLSTWSLKCGSIL